MDTADFSLQEQYSCILFTTGKYARLAGEAQNIKVICEAHFAHRYIPGVAVAYKNPEAMQKQNIIACLTALKKSPAPLKKFIGDLSDTKKVLAGLGIKQN